MADLEDLLKEGRLERGAAPGVPKVTVRTTEFRLHELAMGAVRILSGTFTPLGETVGIDIDAAYSVWGTSRAALILYVGQPEEPGSLLYDSGGKPVAGATWYAAGSVTGESMWATTTTRHLVLDVEPGRPVTWQLLGGIIGGSATLDVPGCHGIAITPDGTRAFVSSPSRNVVTPIRLGRPWYSQRSDLSPDDHLEPPVPVGGTPTFVTAGAEHVVVSNESDEHDHVAILSVARPSNVRHATFPGGSPLGSAITPDGRTALVGSVGGRVTLVDLSSAEAGPSVTLPTGRPVRGVAVLNDGSAAFAVCPEAGTAYRLSLPSLEVEAEVAVGESPWVVRVAPDAAGLVWVLGRPEAPAPGRLRAIDPATNAVVADHELPFASPNDLALVPVDGQTCDVVQSAWVVYDDRYSQFNIDGPFAGQVHSFHRGSFIEDVEGLTGVALNDYGEIWVVRSGSDLVWKWPGGRMLIRPNVFFGEYCTVSVHGAAPDEGP